MKAPNRMAVLSHPIHLNTLCMWYQLQQRTRFSNPSSWTKCNITCLINMQQHRPNYAMLVIVQSTVHFNLDN